MSALVAEAYAATHEPLDGWKLLDHIAKRDMHDDARDLVKDLRSWVDAGIVTMNSGDLALIETLLRSRPRVSVRELVAAAPRDIYTPRA